MHLEIDTTATPADQDWRRLIEHHCSLTLRPLGQRVRRVAITLEQANHDGLSYFVSNLKAKTSRNSVHIRTQHGSVDHAIGMAFARARRELLRQFGS